MRLFTFGRSVRSRRRSPAARLFANLQGSPVLTVSDFVVI